MRKTVFASKFRRAEFCSAIDNKASSVRQKICRMKAQLHSQQRKRKMQQAQEVAKKGTGRKERKQQHNAKQSKQQKTAVEAATSATAAVAA